MEKVKIAIYGASLGGETVKECLALEDTCDIACFLDDDPRKSGMEFCGLPIRSSDDLEKLSAEGVSRVALAVANASKRLELRGRLMACRLEPMNVIHPRTYIAPSVKIGKGNYIKAGAVIETNSTVGDCCIIDNGVIVAHDNVIEDACHLAPGVVLGSSIVVGSGSIIGIGASISTKIRIGKNVIVSVGTSVTRDVPDNSIVEGVPGKIIGRRK